MMSDAQATLFAALAKVQNNMPVIGKNRSYPGPGGRQIHYADINDILRTVLPILSEHGLAIYQGVEDGRLVTHIVHEKGGHIHDGGLPIPSGKPQDIGSSLTYMRRYGLSAMLGIASDEDTDAQGVEKEAKANDDAASDAFLRSQDALLGATGVTTIEEAQGLKNEDAVLAFRDLGAQWERTTKSTDWRDMNPRERKELSEFKDALKNALERKVAA